MSSSMGTILKVTTLGESHGQGVGAVLDGCPAGLPLQPTDIQVQLDRRRPGQSRLTTPRDEADRVTILSGVENGKTLGSPIVLLVANRDARPVEYAALKDVPRPSHADYTYQIKYGRRAFSGGGRSSARETIGRVAAGAIAEKFLFETHGIEIVAWVSAVGGVDAPGVDELRIIRREVDQTPIRCPVRAAADEMIRAVQAAGKGKDSLGGIISCVCRHVPPGLGEPVFDKLEAALAGAMLSIPATKGFEIGSGFSGSRMSGSQHNDAFVKKGARLGTRTNYSGGVQGGISNGEPIVFRVAFKPPATIGQPQETADFKGRQTTLVAAGRHDPCVVPRAVPIVESMAALVIGDMLLRRQQPLNIP